MKQEIWLANGILVLHTIVVGITVAGGVAIFTGRFAKFHKKDYFALAFIACCLGQIVLLLFTRGVYSQSGRRTSDFRLTRLLPIQKTFLEQYLPFLPESIIHAVPFITLRALAGAIIQITYAVKRKKLTSSDRT